MDVNNKLACCFYNFLKKNSLNSNPQSLYQRLLTFEGANCLPSYDSLSILLGQTDSQILLARFSQKWEVSTHHD